MRIAILGNSGAGKSTLAQGLAAVHQAPVLDLDTVYWVPDQIAVRRDPAAARADVHAYFDQHPDGILEGCYADLVRESLAARPVLLFLDPDVATCIAHCRARPWEPHKYPSPEAQDARLEALLDWVRAYPDRLGELGRAAHLSCFQRYDGPKHRITQPPSPDQIATLAASLHAL